MAFTRYTCRTPDVTLVSVWVVAVLLVLSTYTSRVSSPSVGRRAVADHDRPDPPGALQPLRKVVGEVLGAFRCGVCAVSASILVLQEGSQPLHPRSGSPNLPTTALCVPFYAVFFVARSPLGIRSQFNRVVRADGLAAGQSARVRLTSTMSTSARIAPWFVAHPYWVAPEENSRMLASCELRVAGARTIDQANAVLRDFLPRFNAQFRVPAQQSQVAYRHLDSSLSLERILCFKHLRQVARDNTVKYQWRTLQLLPGQERPSYAGVKVGVLEQCDGQLMVQYGGEVVPHQEVPPRPGALRASNGSLAPTPELAQVVRNLSQHGLSRLQMQRLAALEAAIPQQEASEDDRKAETPPPREVTPRKQPLWKAVHHARLQGVSLRGIARELGISRNTVRKYVDSLAPPVNRTPRRSTKSATRQNAAGHFP